MENKIHYDWSCRKQGQEFWTRTICGLKDIKHSTTLKIDKVSCKNCLKALHIKS